LIFFLIKINQLKYCLVVLIILSALTNCIGLKNCYAAEPIAKCTVLISLKIKPYLEAVDGIREAFNDFSDIETEFFFLEDIIKSRKDEPFSLKGTYQYKSVIAVGPEAVLFLKSNPPDQSIYKIYTMVSNPSSLLPQQGTSFCGFFLSVNARDQIRSITRTFPKIKSVGILYDEQYNKEYISRAKLIGLASGIEIQPLMVSAKEQVPELLRNNWDKIDGLLLIPDATVISASLVKYIIKDGISHNVPVIGYNNFFIHSGALMAFVYDYQQIGRTTALFVKELLLNNGKCQTNASEFHIVVNSSIEKYLGFKKNE